MRMILRRVAGGALALAVTAGIVALSRAPYATATGEEALLRLSWSGRPQRIEECRRVSAEELASRPAHMRREIECEGRPARYIVRVRDDEVTLAVDTVTGGGLRGDRAIHMLRAFPLVPGEHRLRVEVTLADSVGTGSEEGAEPPDDGVWRPGPADRERRELEELRRQRQDRLPPELRFDAEVTFVAGMVLLVRYDPIARRLVGITGS